MKIRKCVICKEYTLRDKCPVCGGKASIAKPIKFSPEDRYANYRRKWKKQTEEK
ncbi:MAG: RNA-protein complex protein Nop10 [Candidatus Methanofastidiosia archaeon]